MINKLAKNIVKILGILFCLTIFTLNIVYVSKIGDSSEEIVTTKVYGVFNILITAFLAIAIILVSEKTEEIKLSRKFKIVLFIIFTSIYSITQIFWINIRQAEPSWDQGEVYSIAVKMYENKWEELENYKYLEMCPQQITISAIFYVIFKLFSNTSFIIIQYANVIANVLTILAIMLISNNIGKQYKVNESRALILIGTFLTLPLLSTFVYGDLMSISMCLFAIYYIMEYGMKKKNKYAILSAIFIAIGYALRMNNLIFIIALTIYLILKIIKEKEDILEKIIILVMFIGIALMPATLIRSRLQYKLDLNKNKQIPTLGYLYMGMQESSRANGWYSDYIIWAWEDVEASNEQYKNAIIERVKYFVQNPNYFVKFYIGKIASMWTETTYASLWYNQTFNFKQIEGKENINRAEQIDKLVKDQTEKLLIYQKALITIIFGVTIVVLIKDRKKLSNEIILLLIIFIGGFLFHILWEAKSRYIIPYILVLIPIASISIDNWKRENNEK